MRFADRLVLVLALGLEAHAEILGVKLGSRRANGRLAASIAAGNVVHAEVRCARGEEVRIELTMFSDLNGDGVLQTGESADIPAVKVKDNGPGDLDRTHGNIVAALAHLPENATSLVVRASAGSSSRRAALRLDPSGAMWWRRLRNFPDIAPNLRAGDAPSSDVCLVDLNRSAFRRIPVGADAAGAVVSHDELRVAYVLRDGDRLSVRIAPIADAAKSIAIEDAESPAWLPDDRLAFIRRGALMVFDDGKITAPGVAADKILTASPKIVVAREVDGVDELRLVDLPDPLHLVALHLGASGEPRLSPDGQRFIAVPKLGSLEVIDRATGKSTLVAAGSAFDARWSPSGSSIVFVCTN